MRIAIAQINPTLGDFDSNSKIILDYIHRAKEKSCDLVVFPEAALFGYHPYDLLERPAVIGQQEKTLNALHKKIPGGIAVLLGAFTKNSKKTGRPYFNSAVFLERGKKAKLFHKQILPSGDVFDEGRYIQPGSLKKNYLKFKGKVFFITICEDIWAWPDEKGKSLHSSNPLAEVPKNKLDLVINLSASPFFPEKQHQREYMVRRTAKHFKAPVLYVNLVGGQDEVIYDGASFVGTPSGKVLASCHQFEEDLNVFNLETMKAWSSSLQPKGPEALRRALVLGLRDYCNKTGIKKVHLGLSGGIDSAVVACLAVDALGAGRVTGIGLPGPYSSKQSLDLAKSLAEGLRISFLTTDINDAYAAVVRAAENSLGLRGFGIAHENIQARLRGLFLMAFSNNENSMLISTGNKSEYAVGYSTLYGDMCGGLAPIGDLTKKQVYDLAKLYNEQSELIPGGIITRAPSAELRPNQKDQDSLPEYDLLDASVVRMVEQGRPMRGKTDEWLMSALLKSEFKRWQAAPILKVSERAFGRGRRWPIANRIKAI